MDLQPGDKVQIIDGPFGDYEGVVDVLLPKKGQIRVLVEVFGKEKQIEVEDWQVDKVGDE